MIGRMEPTDSRRQLIVGAGGALLFISLFLPWEKAGGVSVTGWQASTTTDIYLAIAAGIAVLAALTGGHVGLFRPDVSLMGAADILNVIASLLLIWLLVFDFPEGASRGVGAILALVGAAVAACGAGDWRVLKGQPVFPRLP